MNAMRDIDPDAVTALIRAAAARHILPRFNRLAAHEIRQKTSPRDLVTVADIETEHELTPAFKALLPGSEVVGEEETARDPAILSRLDGDGPVWIIDPVDGTANFVDAVPCFAVLVALSAGEEIRMAWIHDPVRNVTAIAGAGGGAWLVAADGAKSRLRRAEPPAGRAALRGSASGRYGERGRVRDLLAAAEIGPIQMLRSAGQEYLALAEARLDYAAFSRILPWDHAAGALIYREAGGVVGCIDAESAAPIPYSPRRRTGPLLSAPTLAVWTRLREIIVGAPPTIQS